MKLIALLLASGIWLQPTADRISVFVGPQVRQGFVDVDTGIIESIRDIQGEIKKSPLFTITTNEQDALVVIHVLGRRIAGESASVGVTIPGATIGGSTVAGVKQPTYALPGTTVTQAISRNAIDTLLKVGTYEKPITSVDDEGSWKNAAKQVVKDLTAWTNANRAQLIKR